MAGTMNKAKSRRSSHNAKRGKYVAQKLRTFRNRQRKLARHIARFPNDGAAKVVLQNLK